MAEVMNHIILQIAVQPEPVRSARWKCTKSHRETKENDQYSVVRLFLLPNRDQ